MSDLISRCELFNRLAPVQTLGEAYGIIQGMDTVDAVPVRHGRWIHRTPNNGHTPPYDECDNCGWEVRIKTNFCPNCGADMREDGEHD